LRLGDHNAPGSASGAGNDRLIGGHADDFLFGDSSADGTVTAAGDDTLLGRDGNDTLFGDNVSFAGSASVGTMGGKDLLNAGDGVDTLRAGPASDLLDGGPGSPDDCDGEAGTDAARSCEILAGVP
jgi:Ca2+-binding RTX toxin-like protein